jgi:hypothetical protein
MIWDYPAAPKMVCLRSFPAPTGEARLRERLIGGVRRE